MWPFLDDAYVTDHADDDSLEFEFESIDFAVQGVKEYLPRLEHMLLRYANYRGCVDAKEEKSWWKFWSSSSEKELKRLVNESDNQNWEKLDWAHHDVKVSYQGSQNLKASLSKNRRMVMGTMLQILADHKEYKDGKWDYQEGYTFDHAAREFIKLCKQNGVAQSGWRPWKRSYMYTLRQLVEVRRRQFVMASKELDHVLEENKRLSAENDSLKTTNVQLINHTDQHARHDNRELETLRADNDKLRQAVNLDTANVIFKLREENDALKQEVVSKEGLIQKGEDKYKRLLLHFGKLVEAVKVLLHWSVITNMAEGADQVEEEIKQLQGNGKAVSQVRNLGITIFASHPRQLVEGAYNQSYVSAQQHAELLEGIQVLPASRPSTPANLKK